MQSSVWINLFRRIPPDQHDTLAIVTSVGIEINIQDLLRIEEDHLVIRGRLAGTTDSGRVFFIPYSQINYLGFTKEVKVAQIMAIYGEPVPAEMAVPKVEAASAIADAAEEEVTPESDDAVPVPPPPEPPPPAEVPKPGQFKIPRKSGLLERLRARAQAGPNPRPPANNP